MSETLAATLIFVATYLLIVLERFPKAGVALLGGLMMIVVGVLDQEEAFDAVDFDVIFLLVGMMVIANTISQTGGFQWVAIKAAKLGGAEPMRILVLLSVITAVASAFLDNVTTVVLVVPVTFVVCALLDVRPVPFLIAEVLASNIGGTATLIGDPPNLLIGSHADLGFTDFVLNLLPAAAIILGAFLVVAVLFWRKLLESPPPELRERLFNIRERELITDPFLLRFSLIVLAGTLLGFVTSQAIDIEPATIALIGAAVLLVASRVEAEKLLSEVEWTTIFFFVGLFIVVAGVEEVGLLEDIGREAGDLTSGSKLSAALVILWLSGFASGVVDNIPYTAAMLPVVDEIRAEHGGDDNVLWWSLALGADLGGNLTIIAASANVLVAGLARRAGYEISFWEFARYGALVTLMSLAISTLYVWLRYFVL